MREVIDYYSQDISRSNALHELGLESKKYFLVSAHRQENVDDPERLDSLLRCLHKLASEWDLPVLVSTHPRTKQKLDARDAQEIPGVIFHEPFGFFDYCQLQKHSLCVASDSGTISEEASILGFPAVTLRSSIERPEALDAGSIIMTDLRIENVLDGVRAAIQDSNVASEPSDYLPANTSVRVRNFILSTAYEHRIWAGLR
jgi:UDP-N-acetylglucosamine 2-epimerase (non-hydrolysing)